MCLEVVYKGKEKRDALAKLPESGYYWKVCNLIDGVYKAEFKHAEDIDYFSFSIGWNETKPIPSKNGYRIAFHAFRSEVNAEFWKGSYCGWLHLVKCRIEKKDIIAVGTQNYGNQSMLTIVTKRIWIPKPKKKSA